MVKLGFIGIYIIFLSSAQKHRVSAHNLSFEQKYEQKYQNFYLKTKIFNIFESVFS